MWVKDQLFITFCGEGAWICQEAVLIEDENNIKREKYTGPSIWEDDRNH
jgi:hypothetical protein